MQGTRIPNNETTVNPGEYSKHFVSIYDRIEVCWMVKAPNGGPSFYIGMANEDRSPNHWVQENEDGTITVRPMPEDAPEDRRNSNSIQTRDYPAHPEWNWHGYIYNGVWQSV